MKKQHHNYQLSLITTTNHYQLITITDKYSTTRLCYKLLDDKYLDKNGKIKGEYKFKINNPKFKIQNSKLIGKPEDKFETMFFLPPGEGRKGEGGLRTKGYFKFSYKKGIWDKGYGIKDKKEWWIVDEDDNPVEKVNLPLTSYPLSLNYLPLITIITVVYNGEEYLEETIQSVINQTYPNVEYIIIDGGSTDRTLDIIKKYEDYIDYWVSEKDDGIYDAMNKGLKVAKGDYIAILNADDYYKKNAVQSNIECILKSTKDYAIANVEYTDGNIIKPIIPLEKKIYQEMPYPHVSALIPLKIYKDVGFFDTNFKIAGDHDMAVRIILKGYQYCYNNKIIATLEKGGISDSLTSNFEFCKVAMKNGKNLLLAYATLYKQILKIKIIKFLPKRIAYVLKKLKRSRFAN